METIARIRREHLGKGVAIKKIVRDLKVSRNTVRKVVRSDETSFGYERRVQPMPKLGPWVKELERFLEANEGKARRDRLSVLRIYEGLKAWRRRQRSLSPAQAHVPLSFDPGEAYQFDWSHEHAVLAGTTTKVKAAHMRLCHSRMFLLQLYPREGQEMVFDAHDRAFHFFGGASGGHLRQHEDGGDRGLHRQGARLQPTLSRDVLSPSGRAGGMHSRGGV